MKTILKYRRDIDDWFDLEIGEFCYTFGSGGNILAINFWPTDSKCALSAEIAPQRNAKGASWTLSGTREKPTLRPSVDAKGIWHGFVTDGEAAQ